MSRHERLTDALFRLYRMAGEQVTYRTDSGEVRPYWPNRYRQALQRAVDQDAVPEFVERMVTPAEPSRGFGLLEDAGRLDLSVEAVVVEQFADLFDSGLVEKCRRRLVEHGYQPKELEGAASALSGLADRISDAIRVRSDGGLAIDLTARIEPDGTVALLLAGDSGEAGR
jgi:hypothetical protein